MKLFIYNREKCMLSVAQEGQRSIRTDRNGCIFLSSALVQELGLQEGSMAVLVGDEDDPKQWFLCIVDDEGGFPVRLKKRKRYNSKGLQEEYCYGLFSIAAIYVIRFWITLVRTVGYLYAGYGTGGNGGGEVIQDTYFNPITRPDRKYVRKKDRTQMEV